jgi:hypothetical protein
MAKAAMTAFLLRGAVTAGLSVMMAACTGAPPSPQRVDGAVALSVPPAPPPKPRLDVRELPALQNISEHELVSRLGTPDFMRKESTAEIWQYRSDTCVLDVFLYPEDGALKVMHAATRDRARLKAPENSCSPFATPMTASAGT